MITSRFSLAMLKALAAGEATAHELEQQMRRDTMGALQIRNREIYRGLTRLVDSTHVVPVPNTWPVRYRLTRIGRQVLAAERELALNTYRQLQERL